jgi:ABC-type nitrate/sulfonate/bicarbonate transport system substrate-binding protein
MIDRAVSRRRVLQCGANIVGATALGLPGVIRPSSAWAAAAPVKVSYSRTAIHHAPFVYLARHAERYGLTIDLLNFDRYSDALVALQGSQLQFSGLGYVNIPTILDKRMDKIRIVAGNMIGGTEIVIRQNLKVENWKDLEGLQIAVSANSMGQHLLQLNAEEHGFAIDHVKFVQMVPGSAALIALRRGEIDGLVAWEPWAAQAVVDGIGYIPKPHLGDSTIGRINGVLGVNTDYAEANRETVVRFMKALIDVDAFLTKNMDEHVKTAVEFMGISPAVARNAIERFSYDENIYIKPARAYANLVYKYGLTRTDTGERIYEAVDFTFLEQASGRDRKDLGDS